MRGDGVYYTSSSSNSSLPTEPGILMSSIGDGYAKTSDGGDCRVDKRCEGRLLSDQSHGFGLLLSTPTSI